MSPIPVLGSARDSMVTVSCSVGGHSHVPVEDGSPASGTVAAHSIPLV